MADMAHTPLLEHPLDRPSAFTPEALLEAVRAEQGIAPTPTPCVCALDFDGDLTDWLVASGRTRRAGNWACFHTTMEIVEIDGREVGIVARAIGGPYAVLIAEQMLASGTDVVIGLTSAGRVSGSVPAPSLVVPTRALRDEGASLHYLPPSEYVEAPRPLAEMLVEELSGLALPVAAGPVWTTDAPYRETAEQLERHAAAGILAVEMQAASLFALAAARGARIGVVAHVTNAADIAGENFDKGTAESTFEILRAGCRAGLRACGN